MLPRDFNMDFAKNLMKKYGWKEGDGLGKNNDGIEKPLRANYKFDNTGLGHDPAADFNNHWWERVYNDAANNIDVKNEAKVSVTTKSSDALEISTKEYSVNKLKNMTGENSYNNFLNTATLSAVGESRNENQIDIEDIALAKYDALSDDQLFAACGGRTAHKGARHGLKLSGKLARIEQQERELLRKMQNQSTTDDDPSLCVSTSTSAAAAWTKKKKKRKRGYQPEEAEPEQGPVEQENEDKLADLLYNADYALMSKKKRRKAMKLDNRLSSCLRGFTMDETNVDEDGDTVLEPPTTAATESKQRGKKHKKRKRKNRQFSPEREEKPAARETPDELDDQLTVNSLEVNCSDSEQSGRQSTKKTKSKKTKKREKRVIEKLVSGLESSVVITD